MPSTATTIDFDVLFRIDLNPTFLGISEEIVDRPSIESETKLSGAGAFTTAGFARMIERAGKVAKLAFKAHPHMLRHACGFALANRGHDTRAILMCSAFGVAFGISRLGRQMSFCHRESRKVNSNLVASAPLKIS
jgi:Phage integrase family